MYFWNTSLLAAKLRANTVHGIDKVAYFLMLLLQLILRITPFNCIPLLYHSLFHYVQYQLAITIQQPTLQFKVFHTINHLLPIALIPFCIVMLIWLYKNYGNKNASAFVDHVVCLNWLISVRVMLVTTTLFLGAVCYAGFYFTTKLMTLSQAAEATPGVIPGFFRLVGKVNVIGKIWEGLKTLKQAEAIFAQMNLWSWYFYWAAQALALLSTLWYFYALKKNLIKSRP